MIGQGREPPANRRSRRQTSDESEDQSMTLAEYPDVGRVEEVAAVLRCSKWSVYIMIEAGELKAVRLGRAIRVTRHALEEFLTS